MRSEYIFPTVLIALDVAAATLTACVTYTGGGAK